MHVRRPFRVLAMWIVALRFQVCCCCSLIVVKLRFTRTSSMTYSAINTYRRLVWASTNSVFVCREWSWCAKLLSTQPGRDVALRGVRGGVRCHVRGECRRVLAHDLRCICIWCMVVLLTSEAYWCVREGSGTCSTSLAASVCFIEYLCVVRLVLVRAALQAAWVVWIYLSVCCRATRVGDADWRVCMLQCNLHGTLRMWCSLEFLCNQRAWALWFWSVSGLRCGWCYGSGLLARCCALSAGPAGRCGY